VKRKTKYASKIAWSKLYNREKSTYYELHINIISYKFYNSGVITRRKYKYTIVGL